VRQILPNEKMTPSALEKISNYHSTIVGEVVKVIQSHKVVIVGMKHNPYVIRARQALKNEKIDFTYLEYGSYFSQWKPRLAIKLWSGWPTFPQVFVNGKLIGGCVDLEKQIREGLVK
jgi:monothiol glutaredoxin